MGLFGPSKTYRRAYLYSLMGDASIVKGEEEARVVHIPGQGGYAVLRDSVCWEFSGHAMLPTKPGSNDVLRRKRRRLMMHLREDDPSPLSIQAGRANRYQGQQLTASEEARLNTNAISFAQADHKRDGGMKDHFTQQLLVVFVISVLACALVWVLIAVTGMIRG